MKASEKGKPIENTHAIFSWISWSLLVWVIVGAVVLISL